MLMASAGVLVLAIAGLYRLRVWGLLLATLGAAAVAVLSLTDAYGLPPPLRLGVVLTSAVQVLLPMPIVAAILRGRAAPPPSAPSRLAGAAPSVLVALMIAACAAISAYGTCWRH